MSFKLDIQKGNSSLLDISATLTGYRFFNSAILRLQLYCM